MGFSLSLNDKAACFAIGVILIAVGIYLLFPSTIPLLEPHVLNIFPNRLLPVLVALVAGGAFAAYGIGLFELLLNNR